MRLVDYLDIHYYPQASGVALTDDEGVAARPPAVAQEPLRSVLRGRVLDRRLLRRRRRAHPADEGLDRRPLSRHEARDHRVQLGRRHRHQLGARAGRGARDLRPRGRRPRHALGRARAGQAGSRTRSASTSTTTAQGASVSGDSVAATSSDVDDVGAYAVAGAGTRLYPAALQQGHVRRATPSVGASPALNWRARLWRFDGSDALGTAGHGPAFRRLADADPSGALGDARHDAPRFLRRARRSRLLFLRDDDRGRRRVGRLRFRQLLPGRADHAGPDGGLPPEGDPGEHYAPPPATGTVFADVPATAFAADWIEDLASRGVTGGCGGGNYCPDAAGDPRARWRSSS